MSLKKNLKRGQASLEYFIIFGLVVVLSILALNPLDPNSFLSKAQEAMQGQEGILQKAANRIVQSEYYQGTGEPGPGPGPDPDPEPRQR